MSHRKAILILLSIAISVGPLLCSPGAASSQDGDRHPLIDKVLFDDIKDGEFFSLANPSQNAISIVNWTVSDGEGTVTFPGGSAIPKMGEITVARNVSRFIEQNGVSPGFSISPNPFGIRTLLARGTFRLANSGDEIVLYDDEQNAVDAVAFGSSDGSGIPAGGWQGASVPSPGRSRMLVRQSVEGKLIDSDSSADWLAIRDFRPGQSSFTPFETQAKVTCLLMPDHSDVIIDRLKGARTSLSICSYEFDSWQVYSALNQSLEHGVKVSLLLERSPAGGISNRSAWLLSELDKRGAEIHFMRSPIDKDSVRRYSYVHSKYVVIDGYSSIVLSENLVYNVFDTELGKGNRGWAAIVESSKFASSLLSIFHSDTDERFQDVSGFDMPVPRLQPPGTVTDMPHRVVGTIPVTANCGVKLYAFPDCTGRTTAIQDILNSAQSSFFAELFYADTSWNTPMLGEIASPMLAEAASLAGRAEEFFVCLDNNSLFSSGNDRNAQAVEFLSAAIPGECGEAQVGFPPGNAPFDIVHNKGMVLDHRLSWISSVNWNYESSCANREIGLLVDDPAVARFFEASIKVDLNGETNKPTVMPEVRLSANRTSWILTLSGISDDTGIKRAEITTEDNVKHQWYCEIPCESSDVKVGVKAIDLWGNVAECEIILFPTETPADRLLFGLTAGEALSWSSAAGMIIVACLNLRARRRKRRFGNARGPPPNSNMIYPRSSNLPLHDDKGVRTERRLQGRGHHAYDAEGSLSPLLLPEHFKALARRFSRGGAGGGDRRVHNGRGLGRAPIEDPDARSERAAPQDRHRLGSDKVIRVIEPAEGLVLDRTRGKDQQCYGDKPLLEAGIQNDRIAPRILQGRGGRT